MNNQPTSAVAARVSTPSGLVVGIPEGSRLVFGRGPDADLTVAAGRGLSRRAGLISAVAGGAWIANISQTHALYTEGDGYRIRLPRMDEHGEPTGGWFLRAGTALVGSRAMLDEGQPLSVMVARQGDCRHDERSVSDRQPPAQNYLVTFELHDVLEMRNHDPFEHLDRLSR